ncbi:MAG: hypothetical protein HY320_04455 [Armatimonadetes bacterium]|nr:hypothetical protein [Armatimonadota bacterium]
MTRRFCIALLALAALGAGTLPLARAQRLVARRQRTLNACVLLLTPPADPLGLAPSETAAPGQGHQHWPVNPYVFYVLNERTDLKPDDLTIVNPAAPATVTWAQKARWDRIVSGTGEAPLTVGQPLRPNMAAYWEVPLTAENYERLAQMHVIYMPIRAPGSPVLLNEEQRRLLTRLVDGGVLLWIDWAGAGNPPSGAIGGTDHANGLFFPGDFLAAGGASLPTPTGPHAVLTAQYRLTSADVQQVGSSPVPGQRAIDLAPADMGGGPNSFQLTSVLSTGAPYLAAGRYGSGFIVMSAGNVGRAISFLNPPAIHDRKPALSSNVDLTPAEEEDLKFGYNLMAWRDEFSHQQKGPRHQATSGQAIHGLMERWSERTPESLRGWVSPLVVDGLVYAVNWTEGPVGAGTQFWVNAYEVEPTDDYNGDGAMDDGGPDLLDLTFSQSYDKIARWPDAGAMNRPAVIGGLAYGEFGGAGWLFVSGQSASGGTNLWMLNTPSPLVTFPELSSLPENRGEASAGMPVWSPPTYSSSPSPGVYVAAGDVANEQGRIVAYAVSGAGLTEAWHYPAVAAANTLGRCYGAPAVVQIQDRRTGAVDQVMLFTSLHNPQGPGGMGGIVISTRGEPMVYPPGTSADRRTFVPVRRTERWDPQRWWEVRIINKQTGYTLQRYTLLTPSGVVLNDSGQPGRLRLPAPQDLDDVAIVADYTVDAARDPASAGLTPTFFRQRRYFVPAFQGPGAVAGQQSGVAGGVAVGKDETIYYGTGRGYMAAVQIESGVPRVRWKARVRGDLLGGGDPGHSQDINPGSASFLSDFHFVSAPAASDKVIVFAGREAGGGAVLFAFEADATISFKLPDLPLSQNNVGSLQLFFDDTGAGLQRIPPQQYTVNPDTGIVTFTDMRGFTLDLNQARRVPGDNRLMVPIQVRFQAEPQQEVDVPVPLVFFYRDPRPSGGFSSSPVVSGDRIYAMREDGVLLQFPVDPRKEDAAFPGTTVPDFNLALWRNGALVRGRQIGDPSVGGCLASPAIGPGVTAVVTPQGVTGFSSPSVLVADRNRILEAAADAGVFASTDGVIKYQVPESELPIPTDPQFTPYTSVITRRTYLDRPATVRRLNRSSSLTSLFFSTAPTLLGETSEHSELADSSVLAADTGNDRVVEFNGRGRVIWELTSFQDPWKLLPAGEPLRLSRPMDAHRWVDAEVDPLGGPPLLVFHTLVADAGNARVLEIVDKIRFRRGRFDFASFVSDLPGQVDYAGQPVRWYHVLVWSSQTNALGLRLNYRTAQRIYWTRTADAAGNQAEIPDPGYVPRVPQTEPPYLPLDPFLTVTVCSANGAQLSWDPSVPVLQRTVPRARQGGDTILFLTGRRALGPGGVVQDAAFRDVDAARAANPNRYVFQQGAIFPDLPLIREVYLEGNPVAGESALHALSGISSLQRTIRTDPEFTPALSGLRRAQYFLITDAAGVFEFRLALEAQTPTTEDRLARLAWAFTNADYQYVTGGRAFTPSSARRLTSGHVLITSRTARSENAAGLQGLGGDVFTLRISDFITVLERGGAPYNPTAVVLHGWVPDLYAQPGPIFGLPSVTWRAPESPDPSRPPTFATGDNPLALEGSYVPDQPVYADLVY